MNPAIPVGPHQANCQPVVKQDDRFSIDCGGTVVGIESDSIDWREAARARYGAFVCHDVTPDLVVHHSEDEVVMIEEHGYSAHIDETGREAWIGAARGTDLLDGVLRTLLPSVIAPDLVAHGALLIDASRAFLCCGVSGSGKSTMAALFPDRAVCDELARLHHGVDGIEVRSLPFWKARPARTALSAIFILEHGEENHRIGLDPPEALREMRQHVYWPLGDSIETSGSFDTLVRVCHSIPVFRLAFRPERSVWATIMEGF